ncbi:carboxypeptidase, partial [Trypanosoma grayi]|uniref:carboxypeptidase n=1 Tax=Trypanosoma grayi TaxID=71804 RepID=UPI0004F48B7B
MEAYKELEKLNTKIYRFRHMLSLAMWDARVMMPPKGAEARGLAVAEVKKLIHQLITDRTVEELIKRAEQGLSELGSVQRGNLREMRRAWELENLLPETFIEKRESLLAKAQVAWKTCRAENDFAGFLPTLKQLIELYREEGKLRA